MSNIITLQTQCFYVKDGQVVEATLADLSQFIETTTRPTGIGYKYYPTTIERRVEAVLDEDDNEIEPAHTIDVWVLAKWPTWGGPEVVIKECESEVEAESAAEETYVYDILNNTEMAVHLDRESAEAELKSIMENA